MSGYGVPAYGGYQNLPSITGVVATGTEELAAEICHNNLFGFGDGFLYSLNSDEVGGGGPYPMAVAVAATYTQFSDYN
nr:hypothetical protein CFP56_78568 [Quercus suber]